MKQVLLGLGLLIFVMINSGCPKPCVESNYSFAINSQISQDLDSVKLGDTIFIISNFPTALMDQVTGTTVDYSNSTDIESTLGIVKLVPGIFPGKDAVNEFDYLSQVGIIYNDNSIASPNKFQQLRYNEANGTYNLKVGIIPKQTGVYYLGIGDGLSNARTKNKNCEKASFKITLFNTNQHFHYFDEWTQGNSLSSFETSRAYFFKVY